MQRTQRRNRIYNPAGLYHWRRKKKMEEAIDESKAWLLTCRECGHVGSLDCTLRELRASRLICSECSMPIGRRAP